MKERIIAYMQQHGSITTLEAFRELSCSRLSEYIRQIRQSHLVMDEWVTSINKHGEKVRYKRYWLVE